MSDVKNILNISYIYPEILEKKSTISIKKKRQREINKLKKVLPEFEGCFNTTVTRASKKIEKKDIKNYVNKDYSLKNIKKKYEDLYKILFNVCRSLKNEKNYKSESAMEKDISKKIKYGKEYFDLLYKIYRCKMILLRHKKKCKQYKNNEKDYDSKFLSEQDNKNNLKTNEKDINIDFLDDFGESESEESNEESDYDENEDEMSKSSDRIQEGAENFKCRICDEFSDDPVKTSCCSAIFCRSELIEAIELGERPECPNCRKIIDKSCIISAEDEKKNIYFFKSLLNNK